MLLDNSDLIQVFLHSHLWNDHPLLSSVAQFLHLRIMFFFKSTNSPTNPPTHMSAHRLLHTMRSILNGEPEGTFLFQQPGPPCAWPSCQLSGHSTPTSVTPALLSWLTETATDSTFFVLHVFFSKYKNSFQETHTHTHKSTCMHAYETNNPVKKKI